MSEEDIKGESRAAQLFQRGQYHEALLAYSGCLSGLPCTASANAYKVHVLFNRSACYLKLKQFETVVEDCNEILKLESGNSRALGRKIKALCSLGHFGEAQTIAHQWIKNDPENVQAKRELGRLDIIVKALNEQDCDDESIEVQPENSGERIPPDGQEDEKDVNSPTTMQAVASSDSSPTPPMSHPVTVVASSNNIPDLNELSRVTAPAKAKPLVAPNIQLPASERKAVATPRPSYSSKVKDGLSEANPRISTTSVPSSATQKPLPLASSLKDASDVSNKWKFRAPPRGLTAQEYSRCPRGDATCSFGDQCTQAHSEEELQEWKQRFDLHQRQMKASKTAYTEQLMERWINAKNPQAVMTDELDGVNVHCSSDLTMVTLAKQCGHVWLFTITSRACLRTVALLDDANREHFHVSVITVGPKRSQKTQKMDNCCQEWTNPAYTSGVSNNEKVYRIRIQFSTEIYGTFRQSVVFDFGKEPVLVRHLCVESGPVMDLKKLQMDLELSEQGRWDLSAISMEPFVPKPQINDADEEELLARFPAPMATKFTASPTLLQPKLTPENYRTRMHHLLYIEEMAQFSSVAKYNVKSALQLVDRFMLMPSAVSTAKFAQNGELFARLTLNAELSEDTSHGRLILQNISTVYLAPYDASRPQETPAKIYEALVEEKGKNFIMLHLSRICVEELKLQKDTDFTAQVQFQLNRLPLCEMHLAVDLLPNLSLLFPPSEPPPRVPWNPRRQWNEETRLNPKQREAVVAISAEPAVHLPPVLLVGPYGTGKTFTLAQATLEVLKRPDARVLICTHSNSAADLYISDYLHPSVMSGRTEARPLRVYYRHRWVQTVSASVRQYCLTDGLGFRVPTRADVEAHRVVVTSLGTSRYLHRLGLPNGFFTHILLDEAAQAMECETILPLALAGPDTRVVLAGDHMQLSPEVHSDFARERGLHVSFLERLYEVYPSSSQCQIMLCENYRSHRAIIDFTSELFYGNKLVASGNQPRHPHSYPLAFFTARGEDVQHQNSTGFYNNAEVYEVVERVAELQRAWPACWGPLDEGSIGVVSPYSDQVMRIRAELRKKKMFKVSVERVLNVQGKQFRAIFLSTVRTSHTCSALPEDLLDFGFLSNVKLLNTAITRAQSLVAVVGDPVSLCSIGKCRKLWERFIERCHQNGSLNGITWAVVRAHLDGVELKKTYILNPLAPEFVPNRLRHACYEAPEPIALGKFGYTFSPPQQQPHQHQPNPLTQQQQQQRLLWPRPSLAYPTQAQYLYQLMTLPQSLWGFPFGAMPQGGLQGSPRHYTNGKEAEAAYQGFPLSQHPLNSFLVGLPRQMLPWTQAMPFYPQAYGFPSPVSVQQQQQQQQQQSLQMYKRSPECWPPACSPRSSEGSRPKPSSGFQFLPNACNVSHAKESPTSNGISKVVEPAKPSAAAPGDGKGKLLDSPLLHAELLGYMQQTEGKQAAASFLRSLSGDTAPTSQPNGEMTKGTFLCCDLELEMQQGEGKASRPSAPDVLSDLEKADTVQTMMRFLEEEEPKPYGLPQAEKRPGPLYLRRATSPPPKEDPPLATPVTPYTSPSRNPFFPLLEAAREDNGEWEGDNNNNPLELLRNLNIKSPQTATDSSLYQYFA